MSTPSQGSLKSPFDPIVRQIVESPTYLSMENAKDLISAIRKIYPSLAREQITPTDAMSATDLLGSTISSLNSTIEKLHMAASTAEGGMNTADLKKVVDAQEKQIRILSKLSETLTANERQSALENAIVEALDEAGDTSFKELLLAKFHEKLGEHSKRVR